MRNMSLIFKIFVSIHILLLFLIQSCSDKNKIDNIDNSINLIIKDNLVNFNEHASTCEVVVRCNYDYIVTVDENISDWCKAVRNVNGNIDISVTDNTEKNIRRGEVLVKAKSKSVKISVAQLGWGKAILFSPSSVEIDALGGEISVNVTTNIEYEFKIDNIDWIEKIPASRNNSHPVVTDTHLFYIQPNKESTRTSIITFSDKDPYSEFLPAEFKIKQKGVDDYEPGSPSDIKEDIKVKVIGGKASSFQPDAEIEKSFDGDKITVYHSNWNNKGENYFPITLEYYFEEGSAMDYFVYYPRPSGYNGLFKEVEIEIKSNANSRGVDEWKKIMSHDFKGVNSPSRVDFPNALVGVSAIRFIIKSGVGDGQGFASCAEMEFYKKNPKNFDWSTLFKNITCSELKDGITLEEILNCEYSFFQNIAYYMYYDKYPSEFRISKFKAYPHPDVMAKSNKTSTYSLLDNPTGIYVSKDDNLIVLADLDQQSVWLRVQNLDKPGEDGYGGLSYPLYNGINKIKIQEKGLIYVMYHTPDHETAPDVNLHFLTGNVNGYFDSQNPAHEGRWNELLGNAKDKYFDVLGKYAHLTFPTSRFRNHTKDGKILIDLFDELVYNEQEFLGLKRYERMFLNRMYFNVMYKSYMYSTDFRTSYNDNTLGSLTDETLLKQNCWGPAHEVGHSNQTRPGMKWIGMTEVTNNIMSLYIQTSVWNQTSRLEEENRYEEAWNNIIVKHIPHGGKCNVFCKLVPFWQLELYFGKVLGNTPKQRSDKGGFYPDVYEYVRKNDDLPDAGSQQLEFVYNACVASETNLLDFFEKWGFLSEIDEEIEDYSKGRLTVTKNDIEEIKERVNSLGYPKPEVSLEYITDNTVDMYNNNNPIVKGKVTIDGNILTFFNWKNVVAFEVKDEEGDLVYISKGSKSNESITVKLPVNWKDGFYIEAIPVKGEVVKVNI